VSTFDDAPTLTGSHLTLAPLRTADLTELRAAAADPNIWAQHPSTDRHTPEGFDAYFAMLLVGGGTLCARETAAGRAIGMSRFYPAPDRRAEWSIGFTFLVRSHWGGAWNREMKALMLGHAFATEPRVWFHIAPGNLRSQVATTRLGAVFSHEATLDLGRGASPSLAYVLTPDAWVAATSTATEGLLST
jgi:RimJ/RimL family protein N-acetyltransferase